MLNGRIQALGVRGDTHAGDMTISFYRNGVLTAQVLPGADGLFSARLAPGFYTLVAYGPSGYCTYGLEAVAGGLPNEPPLEGQASNQIDSLAVPSSDFEATQMLARKYAARSTVGPLPTVSQSEAPPAGVPSHEAATMETSLQHHTVTLEPDGSVPGRLNLATVSTRGGSSGPMTAFLIRSGAVVRQAPVSADGSFRFSKVTPGTYSFVTAGAGGFSAFSVVIGTTESFHATAPAQ